MLKKENIICISSIDWDFVWQGHQEIMATFARAGNRVLFIENTGVRVPDLRDIPRLKKRISNWLKSAKGFRKEMDNLYVYSPLVLPFPYARLARWINRLIMVRAIKRWMKIMDFFDPIIWTFLPTGTALEIINNLDSKLLVYYCIANFNELVTDPRKIRRTEEELLKKSDLVFAQGELLSDKCRRYNPNVHIFPFGVKIETFENFHYASKNVPSDIRDIPKPIVGYIGGVHRHIDFQLLKHLARKNPDWSIVLVGPLQTGTGVVSDCRNIFFLGKKDFSELPAYVNEFSVGIIPYLKTGYTETVYPTKLNEYHALGKPVVSTDLPEVVKFNRKNSDLVAIARTYDEFTELVGRFMSKNDVTAEPKRRLSARKNSWTARVEKMSDLIQESVTAKFTTSADWKNRLLRLYSRARSRALKAAFIFVVAYGAVFYTPLVWFFAAPLKISQQPQKADCIAVFAGGVGESGQAGQGYEERVEYAVDLYKKGFAKSLIFSSGYAYRLKEAEVMKAVALSMGVPEKSIILEEKAANTYENVKFTNDILDLYGWKKVILVSSPYHMLRASLVFKKTAADKAVIYAPIPDSLFYSHPEIEIYGKKTLKKANLQQISAIIHEYIGIAYYWLKGYI